MRTSLVLLVAMCVVAWGCGSRDYTLSDQERATISASIDSAMQSFQAAERALDVERVIAHMAPDFYMYNDGERVDYSTTTTQIRQFMTTLQSFEPGFDNIHIMVLGRNGAVASFAFRDSIVDGSGATLQFRGPTTMVWQRRGLDWLITYVDADHYAEEIP